MLRLHRQLRVGCHRQKNVQDDSGDADGCSSHLQHHQQKGHPFLCSYHFRYSQIESKRCLHIPTTQVAAVDGGTVEGAIASNPLCRFNLPMNPQITSPLFLRRKLTSFSFAKAADGSFLSLAGKSFFFASAYRLSGLLLFW